MRTITFERQREILALEPALNACALSLSGDQNEAHELTHLTLMRAFAEPQANQGACATASEAVDMRLWLFGLLRTSFHSVERQRQARRERGFTAIQHKLDHPELAQ